MPTDSPSGVSSQGGWRWCNKCQVLFFSGIGAGVCPAGGGHDASGSAAYLVANSPYPASGQESWRWCSRCQGLFFCGNGAGSCPAGGGHTQDGSGHYSMKVGVPQVLTNLTVNARLGKYDWGQAWSLPAAGRGTITFTAVAKNDVCLAISPQLGTVSPMYEIVIGGWGNTQSVIRQASQGPALVTAAKGLLTPGGANQLWVSIDSQSGTILVGRGAAGQDVILTYVDPQFIGNAQQVTFGSWDTPIQYSGIAFNATPASTVIGQQSWRWCYKCQAIYYVGSGAGHCAAGGPHDSLGSTWYMMPTALSGGVIAQQGWRWCSKCQVLFFSGNGAGACPAGGGHDGSGSGAYLVASSPYATGGQEGWRWCSKCQGLNFSGNGAGSCPTGGGHTQDGSAAYSMKVGATQSVGILAADARLGRYDWNQAWTLPAAGRGTVTFTAQAENDVHIGISPQQNSAGPMYEIVIGGWANTQSVIRRAAQGPAVATAAKGLLTPGGANQLWVSIDSHTGTIQAGRGAAGQDVVLSYVDPQFIAGAQQVTFSSWNTPSVYNNINTIADFLQPYIETQCKLIVDYDANQQQRSVFEVVLIPRSATGASLPGSQVTVVAGGPLSIVLEAKGTLTNQSIAANAPFTLTAAPSGRCRFTILPTADQLTLPVLRAQSSVMATGQWAVFSADGDFHAQLAQVNAGQLLSTPPGKPGPLLPASRSADATALAGAVAQLMKPCVSHDLVSAPITAVSFAEGEEAPRGQILASGSLAQPVRTETGTLVPRVFAIDDQVHIRRVLPTPAATAEPLSFSIWGSISSVASSAGSAISGAASSAGGAISGAANTAGGAITGAANTAGGAITGAANTAGGAISNAATVVAQRTASTASSVGSAIASHAPGVVGTAAQYLDTAGAAAQILIKNADIAILRPAAHFVTNTIATAQQLAIDVSNGIVVIALVIESGAQVIVKTVVEDVDSAAMIVGGFLKRVGLEIKAVIDFLAMLFDWDAILRKQAQMQQFLDARFGSFGSIVQAQRPLLAGRLKAVESMLSGLGSAGDNQTSSSTAILNAFSSLGGHFGWLVDKLESYLVSNMGLPSNLDLGPVTTVIAALSGAATAELEAFTAVLAASQLYNLLKDPKQIFSLGPQALLAIIGPVAAEALKILGTVADQLLAVVPVFMSAIQKMLQAHIAIPVLTSLIELVVFHNKQKLSLESLLTLVAAALDNVIGGLFGSQGLLAFADATAAVDPQPLVFMTLTLISNFIPAMLSSVFTFVANNEGGGKIVGQVNAICGLLGGLLTLPIALPGDSYLIEEQWLNSGINLIGSVLGLADAWGGGETIKNLCAACGITMLVPAIVCDSIAINHGHGDAHLARFDLVAQLAAAANNLVPRLPEGAQIPVTAAANWTALGAGLAALIYVSRNKDAQLG